MRYLFGLALLAICLAYNVQLHAAEKSTSYSKKQVLADINQLVRLLKRNHPNLYAHQNSKKFKATIKKVKSEVTQKMSRLDAAIQFQKILASVCDEHTGIVFSPKNERATYGSARYLDSSLILRQGRIVVGNNRKSTNSEVILKIGNHQADEINSYMQSLHSQDGCLDTNTDVIGGANYQSMLFLGNFFKDIKFGPTLEFRNHSTQVVRRNGMFFSFTRVVESLGYVHAVKMIMADIVIKKEGFVYEKSDFSKDFFDGNISSYLYHNEEFNYFYIKVDSFFDGKQSNKLIDKSMRKIISANSAHVIIDLTDNPGGRVLSASRFLSYFLSSAHRPARYIRVKNPARKIRSTIVWKSAKRKKGHFKSMRVFRRVKRRRGQYRLPYRTKSFGNPDYKGSITVLVGPRTHSAATMVAAILKNKRKAKIVGYLNKRSIATACYAPAGSFRLNKTRILVDIPFSCYDRDKKKYSGQEYLKPDIIVNPMVSSSSDLNGRIIEAALKDLAD